MQVYVTASSINAKTVNVIGTFDDGVVVDPSWASGAVCLSLPSSALVNIDGVLVLREDWKEANKNQILRGEATKRINEVFPEYSQLNSNAEMNEYIRRHGADQTKWPRDVTDRATEMDRCWAYVNAVRESVGRLMSATLPDNPVSDTHWPSRIQPFRTR